LVKSFRFLRRIVDETPGIKATQKGLVIQGESGAEYLLKGDNFLGGDPQTIVLNAPNRPLNKGVCIHTENECKLPLGDRIAALALSLVNDIKTARKIEQLARVVDEFLEPGWR
jgi:hypothetical protein